MNLTYARETVAQAKPGVMLLVQEHWDEVGSDKTIRKLDPDYESFAALERQGQLHILTVRDSGVMVGYAVSVIHQQLHARGAKSAMVDAVFLTRSARQGRVGISFLKYVDAALVAFGANFIYWHIKPERDFSPVLQRMVSPRYQFIESVYGRSTHKDAA